MTTTGAEQDRDEQWAYGYSYRDVEAMDRFDAFEAGVLAGASEARENLKGWVLLVGDPRGGFSVIGPFPSQDAAGGPRVTLGRQRLVADRASPACRRRERSAPVRASFLTIRRACPKRGGCRRCVGTDLALLIFARCACVEVGQRPAPRRAQP